MNKKIPEERGSEKPVRGHNKRKRHTRENVGAEVQRPRETVGNKGQRPRESAGAEEQRLGNGAGLKHKSHG